MAATGAAAATGGGVEAGGFVIAGAEGGAAAAGLGGVRVLDLEAAAHIGVDVVDNRAGQVAQAGGVDNQGDRTEGEGLVARLDVLVEGHAVLKAGAAAACDVNAEGEIAAVLLSDQGSDFRRGGIGQAQRGRHGFHHRFDGRSRPIKNCGHFCFLLGGFKARWSGQSLSYYTPTPL